MVYNIPRYIFTTITPSPCYFTPIIQYHQVHFGPGNKGYTLHIQNARKAGVERYFANCAVRPIFIGVTFWMWRRTPK
jgi:hypothetical protein